MNRNRWTMVALIAAFSLGVWMLVRGLPGIQKRVAEQKKYDEYVTWRNSHEGITALELTIGGLGVLEGDSKTRLSKSQAIQAIALMKAWRHKPVMTDAQASAVNEQVTALMTASQAKVLAEHSYRTLHGGPDGPNPIGPTPLASLEGPLPPGWPSPPVSSGPPGAPPFTPDPAPYPSPKEYNPLNPDSLRFPGDRQFTKEFLDGLYYQLSAASDRRVNGPR